MVERLFGIAQPARQALKAKEEYCGTGSKLQRFGLLMQMDRKVIKWHGCRAASTFDFACSDLDVPEAFPVLDIDSFLLFSCSVSIVDFGTCTPRWEFGRREFGVWSLQRR